MNLGALLRVPSHVFMAAFFAVFFAYVDLYLYYTAAISIPAAYMFLALLAGYAFIVLMQATASPRFKSEMVALYAEHAWVLASLGAIVLAAFAFAFLPTAYWNEGSRYVAFPVLDSLVVLLAMLLPVFPHHRRWFRLYVLFAFAVFLSSVFWDAYVPGTFTLVPDRAAGLAQNPNVSAFVLVVLCCCLVDFERHHVGNLVVIALTSLGVLATMSRGGGLLLSMLFGFYCYRIVRLNRYQVGRLLRYGAVLLVAVAVIFMAGVYFVRAAGMFSLSFQPRLGMLSGEADLVPSDESRVELVAQSLDAVIESPVLGYGTGHTYSWETGPHNIYLQQWVNNGLPGLAAYLMLLGACARVFFKRQYPPGQLFVSLIAVQGFFNHNLLEERAFLALLGVLLTLSFYQHRAVVESRRLRVPVGYRARRLPIASGART
jgi:O-antigen ligase